MEAWTNDGRKRKLKPLEFEKMLTELNNKGKSFPNGSEADLFLNPKIRLVPNAKEFFVATKEAIEHLEAQEWKLTEYEEVLSQIFAILAFTASVFRCKEFYVIGVGAAAGLISENGSVDYPDSAKKSFSRANRDGEFKIQLVLRKKE